MPLIDLSCPADIEFGAQAFTVPVSNPPTGTFIFECGGDNCPFQFVTPSLHVIPAVSSATLTIPIAHFVETDYRIFTTFIPDDPNLLPAHTWYLVKVGNSPVCPTDVGIFTNGPPPTP
jgi:hypothetical protein